MPELSPVEQSVWGTQLSCKPNLRSEWSLRILRSSEGVGMSIKRHSSGSQQSRLKAAAKAANRNTHRRNGRIAHRC